MKLVEFGEEPYPFIRSQLAQGRSLSRMLLDLPLESGAVRALLPEEVSTEAALRFGSGGILQAGPRLTGPKGWDGYRVDRSAVDAELIPLLGHYLQLSNRHYGLFEHALANRDDSFLARVDAPYCTHQNDVLFLVGSRSDEATITTAKRMALSYLSLGIVTTSDTEIRAGIELSVDQLRELADRATHIVVSAYDGESDLIWSRD